MDRIFSLLESNPVAQAFGNRMTEKSLEYAARYNVKITPNTMGYNDEADAFRHAYEQAYLVNKIGTRAAKQFGDIHENDSRKPQGMSDEQWNAERNMDLWNNAVGREIGEQVREEIKWGKYSPMQVEDMMAEKIYERLKKAT